MNLLKNKWIQLALIIALIIASVFAYNNKVKNDELAKMKANQEKAAEYVKKGNSYFDESKAGSYNIKKADGYYHEAYQLDPNNERALFQLVRVHYVQGEFDGANEYGEIYKNKYPNKGRIHYILGLNNAYAGDLDRAEKEFQEFIKSGESTTAGYLDLSWVYFQKGDFEAAKKILEEGIKKYGDNAWLNINLAMVKFNLGEDKKEVLALLDKAEKQAEKLTPKIWKISYSSNNPADYENDIKKFKEIIAIDKKVVNGGDVSADVASITKGLDIEALSPKGLVGGYAVSACCDSRKGKSCKKTSDKNSCGMYVSVSGKINCAGDCDITWPKYERKKRSRTVGECKDTVCVGVCDTFTEIFGDSRKAKCDSCVKKCTSTKVNSTTPSDDYCRIHEYWTIETPQYYDKEGDCSINTYGEWSKNYDSCTVTRTNKGTKVWSYYREKFYTDGSRDIPAKLKKPSCVKGGSGVINKSKPVVKKSSVENPKITTLHSTQAESCEIQETKKLCEVFPADTKCVEGGVCNPDNPDLNSCTFTGWHTKPTGGETNSNNICKGTQVVLFDSTNKAYCTKIVEGNKECDDTTPPNRPDDSITNPTEQTIQVEITKEWSTDKIHWSDNFDKVILLKSKNQKIYFKTEPKPKHMCMIPNLNKWGFGFTPSSNLKLKRVGNPITIHNATAQTLQPTEDADVNTIYTARIKTDYCGSNYTDTPTDIKFKIVDIKQEEI